MKDLLTKRDNTKMPVRHVVADIGWDDMFEDFFRPFGMVRREMDVFQPSEKFMPRIDVYEENDEIKVTAELPGMDEKAVKVELDEGSLTLSGEKKEEHEQKTTHGYRVERRFGSFERSIPLPGRVDVDKAKAEYKNGILTVTIPKVEEPRKHLEIKVG